MDNVRKEFKTPKVEILIVEDSPTQSEQLRYILEQNGYRVSVAGHGREALARMHQYKPTLVISDVVMPEMDGYELCRQIRADENLKDVPVILLTALSDPTDVLRALECGASNFITKPYDEKYLLSRIHYILTNMELRKGAVVQMGINIFFAGQNYFINAERLQVLDLLISTYETAVQENLELIKTRDELRLLNEHLEEKVEERTAALTAEIAERRRVEEQLRKLSRAIEQCPSVVIITDVQGRIEYVNPKFTQVTGYTPQEVIGMSLRDLEGQSSEEYQQMWQTITSGGEWRGEFYSKKKNGEPYWVLAALSPIRNQAGNITHFLAVKEDITRRKRDEETIRYLAYYDALTDLPNRLLFNDRLTLALAKAQRSHQMLAIMFLDLDRFKIVNDTLGHALGDRLLQGVAHRLISTLGEGDVVARMGGDDFMLLLTGILQVEEVVQRVQKILEILRPSFNFEGYELHITPSIGIALYPDDGKSTEALLKNADVALHRAKEQGGNTYQFYTSVMNAAAFERLTLENSLRRALEREEFVLYYQPQVSLDRGEIVGMEALVRWQHPELGLVSPAKFIPLAEETGLIIPIGEWVLQTACAQNKTWEKAGFPPLRVAVNLSARHFKQKSLIGTVAWVLKETRFDPYYLDLELTEGAIMENAEATITTLRELKEMGLRISIDDFGTGYSSLGYLKRFPIDILKIDQSFVQDISIDPDDAAIVRLIITMAHTLKLKVIAEGVEAKEQLEFLRLYQCEEVQGYLFSKPVPAETFTQLLQKGGCLSV